MINLTNHFSFDDDGARFVTLGNGDIIHEPIEPPCQDITGSEVTEPK